VPYSPSLMKFLAQHSIPVVLHVPYSPSLTPPYSSFFLFPMMKRKKFQYIADTQLNATWYLHVIQKQAYKTCWKWKNRWNNCIQSGGTYFEGHNSASLISSLVYLQQILSQIFLSALMLYSLCVKQNLLKYSVLIYWTESQWGIKWWKLQ
jgi:hypothetical protein